MKTTEKWQLANFTLLMITCGLLVYTILLRLEDRLQRSNATPQLAPARFESDILHDVNVETGETDPNPSPGTGPTVITNNLSPYIIYGVDFGAASGTFLTNSPSSFFPKKDYRLGVKNGKLAWVISTNYGPLNLNTDAQRSAAAITNTYYATDGWSLGWSNSGYAAPISVGIAIDGRLFQFPIDYSAVHK